MPRSYGVAGPSAAGTATKTALTLVGGTTVRPRIFDVIVASSSTPADQTFQAALQRWTTSAGTSAGSPPTGTPMDASDVAAAATVGWTHSGEPTYTANIWGMQVQVNQRATFRWVASPGCEFMNPATATTGLGVQMVLASASLVMTTYLAWLE